MSFTNEELVERRNYLGASESAAALGLSNFFSQYKLYKSKIGEGEPIEETLPMMVGTALEPIVLRMFEKESGLKLSGFQKRVIDPSNPWRRSTLDAEAEDGGNVQAKSSGMYGWWGNEEDAVHQPVIYQCQHEMACNGATHSWVPVILGQRTFKIYRVERNDELIELLTAGEAEFMRRVHDRDPPPPKTAEDLKIMYPVDIGTSLVATIDIEKTAYSLAKTKAQIKALESSEEADALAIKEFMGTAAILKDANGNPLVTWKANQERRLDVTTFRKDHPGLAEQYSPEKTVRKLLCKIKG